MSTGFRWACWFLLIAVCSGSANAIDFPYQKIATNGITPLSEGYTFNPFFASYDFEFRNGRISYAGYESPIGGTYKDGSWSRLPTPSSPAETFWLGRVTTDGDEHAFWTLNYYAEGGIYRTRGGSLEAVLPEQEYVYYGAIGNPVLRNGHIAYFDFWSPGPQGLLTDASGSLATVVDTNTDVPGGTGKFNWFGPVVDYVPPIARPAFDGESVAFYGANEHQQGIYTNVGGPLRVVADTNTPVPGGIGNFVHFGLETFFGQEALLEDGQIVFYGFGENNQQGIYLDDGISLRTLVDKNTPVPGGGQFVNLVWGGIPAFDDGRFAFFAAFRETPESASRTGLFVDLGDGLRLLATEWEQIGNERLEFFASWPFYSQVRLDGNQLAFNTLGLNGGMYLVTVPEPSTLALGALGLLCAFAWAARRASRPSLVARRPV